MAKILGLDIPDGLENLFRAALQLKPNGDVDGIGLTLPKSTFRKKQDLRGRSLFIALESTWRGFDSTRRNAWQSYWETLPFGSHSGSNGWPGSGYSAFVYVNAPRIKANLDLLLDPPLSSQLLLDPDLTGEGDLWTLEGFEYTSPGIITTGTESFPQFFQSIQPIVNNEGGYTIKAIFTVEQIAGEYFAPYIGGPGVGAIVFDAYTGSGTYESTAPGITFNEAPIEDYVAGMIFDEGFEGSVTHLSFELI